MSLNTTVWVYIYTKRSSQKYNHVKNLDRNQLVQLQCNEEKKKKLLHVAASGTTVETLPESETEVVLNLKRAFLFP